MSHLAKTSKPPVENHPIFQPDLSTTFQPLLWRGRSSPQHHGCRGGSGPGPWGSTTPPPGPPRPRDFSPDEKNLPREMSMLSRWFPFFPPKPQGRPIFPTFSPRRFDVQMAQKDAGRSDPYETEASRSLDPGTRSLGYCLYQA